MRTAFVSARIAAALSLPDDRRADLLYAGLLSRRRHRRARAPSRGPTHARTVARVSPATGAMHDPQHLSRPHRARAVVATLGLPAVVGDTVATADERWDGRGPAHTHGDQIPRGGRLLALAAAVAAVGPTATAADIDRMLPDGARPQP